MIHKMIDASTKITLASKVAGIQVVYFALQKEITSESDAVMEDQSDVDEEFLIRIAPLMKQLGVAISNVVTMLESL